MALNFTDTHTEAIGNGVKILGYGRAGMGKTRFCATAPKPLILSAESGLLSLASFPNIPVLKINNIQDLKDAYTFCQSNPNAQVFETVCLDSLSEILEQILSAEKAKTKDPRQAYGGLIEEGIKLVKQFRDLPRFNVIVTCKEEAATNTVTGVTRYAPAAPGQTVGPELPYLFDEVFHLSTGTDNLGAKYHYIRTQPDIQTDAKDRSGKLDEIEYPDATHLINKIKGTA